MKEIIKNWCNTGELSVESAMSLLSEFLSYEGKNPSPQELTVLLQIGSSLIPIDWKNIIGTICQHNNWNITRVVSAPNNGARTLLKTIFIE